MFEPRRKPLLPLPAFYARVARSLALAFAIVLVSLGIGMTGYHVFENLPWLAAFLNAATLIVISIWIAVEALHRLSAPVAPMQTTDGKLFAGCYALFSGLALITTLAVIFAPLFHRFLHKFHFDADTHER